MVLSCRDIQRGFVSLAFPEVGGPSNAGSLFLKTLTTDIYGTLNVALG